MTKKEQDILLTIIDDLANYISDVQMRGTPLDNLRNVKWDLINLLEGKLQKWLKKNNND